MAAHSNQENGTATTDLPDVLPFDLSYLTRLSWDLGTRVVTDDESTLRGRWAHTRTSWTLSVIDVTENTALLRLRTPVGRERFYGTTQAELSTALSGLDAAPNWTQTA
ncbi:hypothetical protein DVK02_11165 [Halobellus sp. Atlit-31R]|nr:hypothetical protein DVK02_11165 [Halobellus sp. Atlit-31R]